MTGRSKDLLRGVAALAGLLGLLVGPPAALVHFVGWPLPRRVPSVEEMTTAARGGIDAMVVVKVLAVLAWLLWAQLALATLLEMTELMRGHVPDRAPVLPVVQRGVARLVAAAGLVVAVGGTQRPAPVPIAHLAAAVAQPTGAIEVPEEDVPPPVQPVPTLQERASAATPAQGYVVRRNDSWWGIAESSLGDGQWWKELRTFNIGRTMGDGSVIDETTETILPGWELLLPVEAAASSSGVASAGAVAEVVVQRGDSLWTIAERHLEQLHGDAVSDERVREHWVQVIEANRDRLADPEDPGRIYIGQVMRMPAVARASPAEGERPPGGESRSTQVPPAREPIPPRPDSSSRATATPAGPAPAPTARAGAKSVKPPGPSTRPRGAEAPEGDRTGLPTPALGVASTMLAVGISAAVARRRRRRQDQLPPQAKPVVPPPELDDLRAELVVNADVDEATRLHRALRDIASALAKRRSEARPRLVQVSGQRIEAVLSNSVVPAPTPWRAEASGSAWALKGEPADRRDDGPVPTPALVTLGRPERGTDLYLDLEAEGVVALTGEAGATADVARSWVLELATSPLSGGASVVVVGDALVPRSGVFDRVRSVATWNDIASDALAWAEQSAALMAASRWKTPFSGRARSQRVDDLGPLIVVAEHPPDQRFHELCAAIVEQHVSVAVVVVGSEVEGATRVEVSGGELHIPSLGLTCQAQAVSEAAAEQVEELLEDAARPPAQLSLMPPLAPPPEVTVASPGNEDGDPPHQILVRFLGDIEVVGATKRLKPKQTAVLAYIALHAPVASGRVEDALWVVPTTSRRKRLANTVSECRNAIGAGHLPLATDGRYRVGPGVATDLELFERRITAAADQDSESAVATLRSALELVEGAVFTYRNADRASYVWVDVENWISTWELKVTDAAEDLAQRYLELGDPKGAVWAARRGLSVCHIHTRLTKLLIQAYFAKKDVRAAERVFESHQAALERLDLDDVDPELVDFYYHARRARTSATG